MGLTVMAHNRGGKGEPRAEAPESHQGYEVEKGRDKRRRQLRRIIFIFSLASCSLLFPLLLTSDPYSSFSSVPGLHLPGRDERASSFSRRLLKQAHLSCDRTGFNSDVCVLRGDIRTSPSFSSIILYGAGANQVRVEKIKPYTRKWETSVMKNVEELELVALNRSAGDGHRCDVVHNVPAVVFSAGGYVGNVYHDFRDNLIPLYITSARYNREAVFLVVHYQNWWHAKYREVLARLSAYPLVDFFADNRTHCFPEITVGLRVHGELAIDPYLIKPVNKTINDFQRVLDDAYRPRIRQQDTEENRAAPPKMVIIFRNGSRSVENEKEVVELCEKVGFRVQVMRPHGKMDLVDIYKVLNSADAMIGVVGCALTHLLFMRPGSVFIQLKPLGTEWAAEANYGDPAKRIGLKYLPYLVKPSESSLSRIYPKDDPVLKDPESISSKGWDVTKKIFLDQQSLIIDLKRFNKTLTTAYNYLTARAKKADNSSLSET